MRGFVVGLMVASIVGAARSGGAQVDTDVHACALTAGGRLRVLAAGAACRRNEHALTWAVTGPPGPKGDTGDTGPTGGGGPPACHAIGLLTLPGVTGDGANGAMTAFAFEVTVQKNTDPAGGPPTISGLTVTKALDRASPALFQAAVNGTPFATARLDVFAAAPPTVATRYDLGTVLISSLTQGATNRCTAEAPTEDVTLSFATLDVSVPP